MPLIAFKSGIHFLCSIVPDKGKYGEPGDTKLMWSLASIDLYGKVFGVRALRIRTEDDTDNTPDDFFDRALAGLTICHGQLIIEILFVRLVFG